MRRWFLVIFLSMTALYKAYQWFDSPRYLSYLERRKQESWFAKTLVRSGRYWSFAQDPQKALVFFDRCLSEDLEKAPERPLCLYYKASMYEDLGWRRRALAHYSQFLSEYPEHEKARSVQKSVELLRMGI